MGVREFDVTLADGGRGRLFVAVPFDADVVWGTKLLEAGVKDYRKA